MHVGALKIFSLAIPMHTSTFPEDFQKLIFQQGVRATKRNQGAQGSNNK